MKKRIVACVLSLSLLFGHVFMPAAAMAAANDCNKASGFFLAVPTWYKYLEMEKNPAGGCSVKDFGIKDIYKVAIACLEILLYVAGLVAFGAIVWMGFKFVLSRGNPSEVAKARQGIIDAVIGFVIAILASTITAFIGGQLAK